MFINNKIKAFFIDLDGTTLDVEINNKKNISKINLQAIRQVQASGKIIVVSTGRMGKSCDHYIDIVKPTYSVTGNGAIILDHNKKIIMEHRIPSYLNQKIVQIVAKYKLVIKLDDHRHAYGVATPTSIKQANLWNYQKIHDYSFDFDSSFYKFVIWGTENKEILLNLQKEIKIKLPDVSSSISNNGYTLEITAKFANKGIGNEFVWKRLKLDIDNTAHIGDSMNDAAVIGHVGKLIVLDNASDQLKQLSPYRGDHYKNKGLAKVLSGNFKKIF